jgi:quercetin dioxygenase-like cupin family protein
MDGFVLRLARDRFPAGKVMRPLPAGNRVLYVVEGDLSVDASGPPVAIGASGAWHGALACTASAGAAGATVLRYELARAGTPATAAAGAGTMALLERPIRLDSDAKYLMRCDRVDFDPGGEARPHGHRGGGIRCLLTGTLELRIEGEPDRVIQPGQAWFESGREPVHALASATEPTSFIRCSILPREIRGQSSIVYVDPRDAGRRPRRYTVFVDEPIELPSPATT